MKTSKLLLAVLTLFMVLVCLPNTVQAAEIVDQGTCGEDLTWVLTDDGTLTISGTGAMIDYGYDYDTYYAPWHEYRNQIIQAIMEPGLTRIGVQAFYDCTNLTNVVIPEGVTEIGGNAFGGCMKLEGIVLPQSLTKIGICAFDYCTSLAEIVIPDGITEIVFATFAHCTNLTKVTLHENITAIGGSAFLVCENLTDLVIPQSVTKIDSGAFYSCISLKEIVLPDGITEIAANTFADCHSLTKLIIPESVTTISGGAFSSCRSLTEINLPTNLVQLGEEWLSDWGNGGVFSNCTALKEINIPNGVTRIYNYTFDNCTSLKNIYYGGTEAQWNEIPIGSYNDCLSNATVHYESQPETPDIPAVEATFKGATLSLNGVISVNFYASVSDPNADVKVAFTVNGEVQEMPISEATFKDGLYAFTCEVAAKQMADEISAQIYVNGQPVGKSITYSVQQYCENKLSKDNTKESLKNLLIAMLNYGTEAQNYFGYNTSDLANAVLTDAQKTMAPISKEMLESFKLVKTGEEAGIARTGASLLLEAETVIRYQLQLKDGYDINSYTFQYKDQTLIPQYDAVKKVYYVDITGIAAKDLDMFYPITIGNLQISYSPTTYVYNKLEDAATTNLVTSLYYYNQMANAYFA